MRAADGATLHPKARRRILESVVGFILLIFGGVLYWKGIESGTGLVTLGAYFIEPSVVKSWTATILPFVREKESPPQAPPSPPAPPPGGPNAAP